MKDSVLAIRELTIVRQELVNLGRLEGLIVQANSITGNLFQTNTANGAYFCTEVALQQILAQTYTFEYLGTTVAADGRDTHLGHNLLQTLIHGFNIMSLGCCIIFLDLVFLHKVVQYGKGHVRTNGAGTVTQKKSSVHYLAYLTALDNQGCLYTLLHTYQIMVNSTYSQQ